jgi:hypothetical protein
MLRLTLVLSVFLCTFAPVRASLTPARQGGLAPELKKAFEQPRQQAQASPAAGEFLINEQTEIRLDGRSCRYEEVPPSAEIILLEVAADRRTVRRIHFRSGR